MGAAASTIAKCMPKRSGGSPQWDDAKGRWVVVLDGKEVADVTIEDPPSLHVGVWKCWIGEKSGEVEELPWKTVGGDQLRVRTDPPTSEGLIQFLLAKIDDRGVNVPAMCRVVSQYEVDHDHRGKRVGGLSLVSLYGWIKRDGHSRWLWVERWRESQRLYVEEMCFRQRRLWLRTMWEYADTNTPQVVVNVDDTERGLAMGWNNGKLYYLTGGSTDTPNPVYVMVDFNDEGCPKELLLRMGRDTETSWIVEKSQRRSQDAGPEPWREPGTEKRVAPSGLWDRLEQERRPFEVGEVVNP